MILWIILAVLSAVTLALLYALLVVASPTTGERLAEDKEQFEFIKRYMEENAKIEKRYLEEKAAREKEASNE